MHAWLALWHESEQRIEELLALGGPVMWPLLVTSILLWTLILERYWFFLGALPGLAPTSVDHGPAFEITFRAQRRLALWQHLAMIRSLSAILPMLGLLGTVTGIVETFDLIRLFGVAEPRIVAHGVSQALITTLTGLVTGLLGIALGYDLRARARRAERRLLATDRPG